jgi:hypothetical protein
MGAKVTRGPRTTASDVDCLIVDALFEKGIHLAAITNHLHRAVQRVLQQSLDVYQEEKVRMACPEGVGRNGQSLCPGQLRLALLRNTVPSLSQRLVGDGSAA